MKYPIIKSESDRVWLKYCGFLDLSMQQFMSIQESLLSQQLERLSHSRLGHKLLGNKTRMSTQEFRKLVPLTDYDDYLPEFNPGGENALPGKPYIWAQAGGSPGPIRRIPITYEANEKQLDNLMSVFILACSRAKGDSSASEGDRVLFNIASQPYFSGILADGIIEKFHMKSIVSPDIEDKMEFQERFTRNFQYSLKTGIDILVAVNNFLVKTGKEFEQHSSAIQISKPSLSSGEFFRIYRALLISKLKKRPVLPRDLWSLKALITWGNDTGRYREQINKYWGVYPYQFFSCTEAGIIAVQSWNRKDMTLIPHSSFYEFIPETELVKAKRNIFYEPETVLLSQVKPGTRYELVITSFYGMPFVRYRPGHLIRITNLADNEADILLPQMIFEARSGELAGTGDKSGLAGKPDNQVIIRGG
jgi:hypothetical protein